MIPKTELRYSRIYNVIFNRDFSKKDFFKLKENCKKFEKLYKKYIKIILHLVEKHHSKKWKYKLIPIYINVNSPSSFSDPLTIRYKKNEKYLLVVLAHELLHNNIMKKFKDRRELHIYMEPILNKIISNIPINLKKELIQFNEHTRKHYKRK